MLGAQFILLMYAIALCVAHFVVVVPRHTTSGCARKVCEPIKIQPSLILKKIYRHAFLELWLARLPVLFLGVDARD